MKKYLLSILMMLLVVMTACDDGSKELLQSKAQIESLQQELNAYAVQFDSVNQQKQMLETEVGELATLSENIKLLLPSDPKKNYDQSLSAQIQGVKDRINSQNATINQLQSQVSRLRTQLTERENQLKAAYAKIDSLTAANASLQKSNEKLMADLAAARKAADDRVESVMKKVRELEASVFVLSRGFYVVDNAGNLRRIGVIESAGVTGNRLNTAFNINENRDKFEVVDKLKASEIKVNAPTNKVKLWTPHLRGSYEVVADPADATKSVIKITQAEEFWMMSSYLVVGNDG